MGNQGKGKIGKMSASESHLSLVRSNAPKVTAHGVTAQQLHKNLNGLLVLSPVSRGKGIILTNRILELRNTETPYMPCQQAGRQTVRNAELVCGNRMLEKRKPVCRKARGIHNPLDRAAKQEYPTQKGADTSRWYDAYKCTARVTNRGAS